MTSYGYARVSTGGQSLYAQVKQLRAAGAEKVLRETASGARAVANGVRLGQKLTLYPHQKQEAMKRLNAGKETQCEIARSYNMSRWTISRLTV
jgi:DNA invertase Pin-like site-specific DNA recombinase